MDDYEKSFLIGKEAVNRLLSFLEENEKKSEVEDINTYIELFAFYLECLEDVLLVDFKLDTSKYLIETEDRFIFSIKIYKN